MARSTSGLTFSRILWIAGSIVVFIGLNLVYSHELKLESVNAPAGLTLIALGLLIDLIAKKVGDALSR